MLADPTLIIIPAFCQDVYKSMVRLHSLLLRHYSYYRVVIFLQYFLPKTKGFNLQVLLATFFLPTKTHLALGRETKT